METVIALDSIRDAENVFGSLNENITLLEKQLDVEIELDPRGIAINGAVSERVEDAALVLNKLLEMSHQGHPITRQQVSYLTQEARLNGADEVMDFAPDVFCVTANGRPIRPKTRGQSSYVEAMKTNEVTFAIGPAGTGKTYLAVAMAVQAFRSEQVERIILTRPAVEAGEKLGFLPGDLQTKVDPYMRPLYDALFDLMGADSYQHQMERGAIEVSPLAYMRGRTLDNAFIILDEAQNTTPEQMKMFLTRIGFNSRAVVTGDVTQIDLPRDKRSGLRDVRPILKNVEGMTFIDLTERDVVRNGLVQRIIHAYEAHEANKRKRK